MSAVLIHPKETKKLKERLQNACDDFMDTEIKRQTGIPRSAFDNARKGRRIKQEHADALIAFLNKEKY